MCAFRDLKKTGSLPEIQERLKTFLQAGSQKEKNKEPLIEFRALEQAATDGRNQWLAENRAVRRTFWNALSPEEKFQKDVIQYIQDGKNSPTATWCPWLSSEDIQRIKVSGWAELVFTTAPDTESRYHRGGMEGDA